MVGRLAKVRTVVRPDYSGSGKTVDSGGPLTLESLSSQVVAAARDARRTPFDLVGFSLGAAVAAHIAAEYPKLVRSVVLLGGFASSKDARQRMQFELWRDLIRTDRHAAARLILLTGFSPGFLSRMEDAAIAEAANQIVLSNNWEGMARQVDLDLAIDLRERVQKISRPVLSVGFAQDQMVPPGHAREMADLIPAARYAEFDSGHLAPLEKPEELTDLILEFLNTHAG